MATSLKFFSASSLPDTLEGNSVYYIPNGGNTDIYITSDTGLAQYMGKAGPEGLKVWLPVLQSVQVGTRVLLQVVNWTGASGTKPSLSPTPYISASGTTTDINQATDIRSGMNFNWRGAWSATGYLKNDAVSYTGNSYVRKADGVDVFFDIAQWDVIAAQGATGSQGIQGIQGNTGNTGATGAIGLNWRGAWQASTVYASGDGVSNGGNSYRRKTAGSSGASFDSTQWDLVAQGGSAADGSISAAKLDSSLSTQITSNTSRITTAEGKVSLLNPVTTYTAQIQQDSSYALTTYTTLAYKEQRSWFYGKSTKQLDAIGVFIFKRSSTGTITADARVQVLHTRASVVTKLLDKTILAADLAKYNTVDAITNYRNYELIIDLDTSIQIQSGDALFISLSCDSALHPIYSNTNKTLSTGEWCDSSGINYRQWLGAVPGTYTSAPTTYSDSNPHVIDFYSRASDLTRIKTIETAIGPLAGFDTSGVTKAITSLAMVPKYSAQIVPNPAYSLTNFTVQKESQAWYFGKSSKAIGAVGVFIYKDIATPITGTARVQVVHRRSGVATKLLDKTIANSDLLKFNTSGIIGGYKNYELIVPFDVAIVLLAGDELFISTYMAEGFVSMYSATNAGDVTGEWNNAGACYRSWTNASSAPVYSTIPTLTVAASPNNYLAINFYDVLAESGQIKAIDTRVTNLESGIGSSALTLTGPSRVYTVCNDLKTFDVNSPNRNYSAALYLDHFCVLTAPAKYRWKDTASDRLVVFSPVAYDGTSLNSGSNVLKTTKTLAVDGTSNNPTLTVEHVSVKASVGVTSPIFFHQIGDSNTNSGASQIGADVNGPWRSYDWIRAFFEMDRIDASGPASSHRFQALGSNSGRTFNVVYAGQTISCKSYSHGIGGWSATDYAYCTDRRSTRGQGVWDLMGLGNGTGSDYTGSPSQLATFFTTPEGKFTPVNTAAFLTYMQATYPTSGITDYASALAKCTALLSNPVNPYFNKDLTGNTRFDFSLYMARYKTLANDGTTRLVVGSTAGSKVTNATSFDLCDPTHVLIQLGTNDQQGAWFLTAIQAMIASVKAYNSNMFIGLACPDSTGTYFPELYPEFEQSQTLVSNSYTHTNAMYFNAQLKTLDNESQRTFHLPHHWVQPTALGTPYRDANPAEFLGLGVYKNTFKVRNTAFPESHPSCAGHAAFGYQDYAWLKYTSTL